jgi:hypothetical protein
MRDPLSLPEIGLIAGTRAALGAGVGLLVADRMSDDRRRAVGWTLLLVGLISTIPIAIQLYRSVQAEGCEEGDSGARIGRRMAGRAGP